ncbi:hypothetical protein BWQ96_08148 [Gracilariopsis chorda]|uniref:Uncharacterized protein n=1 Tax=Gracilariopsis chorda TaxID=448386 RepID=A0A2V3IJ42_9FLOR|nr:hypothetical protein BWQ96_08148 [Gracilariopsis chorda]|eukprot:PXF42116.1 hypothetical protein BWQ96_08148 [Gracilariopsis chorda]
MSGEESACAQTGLEEGGSPSRGKNLTWDEKETQALVRAAAAVCTDPAVGSSMSGAELGRRIRSVFIKDNGRPQHACSLRRTGCELDQRRWDGRSADGCRKYWDRIRAECTRFKACYDRVIAMNLTGNVGPEDLIRCAALIYSDGSNSVSHLYDCVRNPNYHIAKRFKFKTSFTFLNENTILLQANGIDEVKKSGDVLLERPMGRKKAKKLKEGKVDGARSGQDGFADSIRRIESILSDSVREKALMAKEKVALQREKLDWEMASKLLASESGVSLEEKREIRSLLKCRLLRRLACGGENNTHPNKKRRMSLEEHEEMHTVQAKVSGNNQTAEALLQLSTRMENTVNTDVEQ